MISLYNVYKYCNEDITKIENFEKALNDRTQEWDCHHRDEVRILPSGITVIRTSEELKERGRYYNCPANELIFLTKSDHTKIHNKVKKLTEEQKQKISNTLKKHFKTHDNPMKNRKHTIEAKFKMRLNRIDKNGFGGKFYTYYGITNSENHKLYDREYQWYKRHGKCRWESM